MIVTFCGHRQVTGQAEISRWLDDILPPLIEQGASTFYLGGYGGFDRLAAAAVRRQKALHPEIESVLVLPYLNRPVDTDGYDRTLYPPLENVPPRYAISKRNEWMVSAADVVVSGVDHDWGGAAKTLACARRKHKTIIQYPKPGSGAAQ